MVFQDVANRLLQVTYPGTDNNTQLLYDPLGRCVKITETTAGSVTSTKQFVWCGYERCEERDGSGSLSNGKQFYGLGQVNYASGTPTNYFYNLDHLGSVREMTKTVSGTTTIEAQYAYGAWGEVTKLAGSADSDFQYAGYYKHARSGLDLTLYRAYSAGLGRWLSRDPLGESAGVNLYGYVDGNPLGFVDPLGLQASPSTRVPAGRGPQDGWFHVWGNWGGPGFTSGGWQSELDNFPNDPQQFGFHGPTDPLDECFYRHDVCLHNAASIGDNECAQSKRHDCDKKLAQCMARVRRTYRTNLFGLDVPKYLDTSAMEKTFNSPNSPNNNPDFKGYNKDAIQYKYLQFKF